MLCVEGTPGCGKALVVRALSKTHNLPVLPFRPSTADLIDLQADGTRWSFYTSLRILCDRVAAIRESEVPGLMVGSPRSDIRCHAAASAMLPCERRLFESWSSLLVRGLPEAKHVLVTSETHNSFAAIFHSAKREQAHLDSAYMEAMAKLYDATFPSAHTTRLSLTPALCENDVILQEKVAALTIQ